MNESLRRDLLHWLERDVQMRRGPVDARVWEEFDTDSTAFLKSVIAEHGWPVRAQVGQDGQQAAWLLAQHSPDLDFQRQVLSLLREQSPEEVDPVLIAFLYDRIAIRSGEPQRYGTQVQADGLPFPLEEGDMDARRAELGLEPLAEYLKRLKT